MHNIKCGETFEFIFFFEFDVFFLNNLQKYLGFATKEQIHAKRSRNQVKKKREKKMKQEFI